MENDLQVGWIYAMTNPDIPGLVKVGFTTNSPEQRAKELAGTGVPRDFKIEFSLEVVDPASVEKIVHKKLRNYHHSKEWFKCRVQEVIVVIKDHVGEKNVEDQINNRLKNQDALEKELYKKYTENFTRVKEALKSRLISSLSHRFDVEIENEASKAPRSGFMGVLGKPDLLNYAPYQKLIRLKNIEINQANAFIEKALVPCDIDSFTNFPYKFDKTHKNKKWSSEIGFTNSQLYLKEWEKRRNNDLDITLMAYFLKRNCYIRSGGEKEYIKAGTPISAYSLGSSDKTLRDEVPERLTIEVEWFLDRQGFNIMSGNFNRKKYAIYINENARPFFI